MTPGGRESSTRRSTSPSFSSFLRTPTSDLAGTNGKRRFNSLKRRGDIRSSPNTKIPQRLQTLFMASRSWGRIISETFEGCLDFTVAPCKIALGAEYASGVRFSTFLTSPNSIDANLGREVTQVPGSSNVRNPVHPGASGFVPTCSQRKGGEVVENPS